MIDLPPALTEKFTELESGCWMWHAYMDRRGYARVSFGGAKAQLAHRVIYELLVGLIPEGLDIDHLCRNRSCVNPSHMEPVTRGENLRRGEHKTMVLHRQGTCQNGHPLSKQYRRKDGRSLGCSVCINAKLRARYAVRKASSA